MRKGSSWQWVWGVAAIILLLPIAAGAAVQRTEVVASDDWPADSGLVAGSVACAGGELVWANPVTPICPESGRLLIRGSVGYGCLQALSDGEPEPRLSGVVMFSVNGNLDAEYSGPVWGTLEVVPADACDPAYLIAPESFWSGVWHGHRSRICAGGLCYWVGALEVVAKGYGGELEGLHFKGTETIVTYTPAPIPWDLIPGFPLTGPEGWITGTIRE